jgi:hypothetical protein
MRHKFLTPWVQQSKTISMKDIYCKGRWHECYVPSEFSN